MTPFLSACNRNEESPVGVTPVINLLIFRKRTKKELQPGSGWNSPDWRLCGGDISAPGYGRIRTWVLRIPPPSYQRGERRRVRCGRPTKPSHSWRCGHRAGTRGRRGLSLEAEDQFDRQEADVEAVDINVHSSLHNRKTA